MNSASVTANRGGITAPSGRRKAATVIVALGPELSAQVLRHMTDRDVEDLTMEVLRLGTVPDEEAHEALEEFYQLAAAQDYIAMGGADYAREMLTKALGPDRAQDVLGRIAERARPRPFDFLRYTDPSQLTTFLQEEHPQTVALVLGHLPPAIAARVLKELPIDLSSEVSARLAAMDRTPPEIVETLEAALQHRMGGILTADYTRVGGAEFMAKVLSQTDRATERAMLDALEQRDPDLAFEVRRLLFTFEDLNLLDDRSLQRVLREVDPHDLPIALRAAPAELQDRVFRNLSSRAAEMLREEIELLGPVRARQVNEAQQRIVNIVRQLEEREEIVVERGGDDVLV